MMNTTMIRKSSTLSVKATKQTELAPMTKNWSHLVRTDWQRCVMLMSSMALTRMTTMSMRTIRTTQMVKTITNSEKTRLCLAHISALLVSKKEFVIKRYCL